MKSRGNSKFDIFYVQFFIQSLCHGNLSQEKL